MVERIAQLSKLKFEGNAKNAIKADLERMIDFVDKLNEIDTENVEPLIFITNEINHLRKDEAKQEITQQEALSNAPAKDSDYFKVPKVIEAPSNNKE